MRLLKRAIFRFCLNIFRIVTADYYGGRTRFRLILCYLNLTAKTSFEPKRNQEIVKASILQYEVFSYGYAQLLALFKEIFIKGEYRFIAEVSHPTIFDCGANIGIVTVFFKILYPASTIYAFEPDSRAFTLLNRMANHNGFNDMKLFNVALSSQDGTIEFYYDDDSPNSLGNSILFERMPKSKTVVKSARLSSYVGSEPTDFVKLDVEGALSQIVTDLAETGTLRRIKSLAIEYHHKIGGAKSLLGPFLTLLEANHFEY